MKNSYITNLNKFNLIIFLIFSTIFLVLNFFRLYLDNYNYLDFGYTFKLFENSIIIDSHINIFTFFLSKIFFWTNKSYLFLIIKSFCYSLPLLYLSKKEILIYLLIPLLWTSFFASNQIDVIIIPCIFILLKFKLDFKREILILLIILSIKEYYSIFIIFYSFFKISDDRKEILFYIIISSLSFCYFFISIFIINHYGEINTYNIELTNDLSDINIFDFKAPAVIIILSLILQLSLKSYILLSFYLIPSTIYFFMNDSAYSNLFSHYYLSIIPILVIFSQKLNFIKITLLTILNILISNSPISYIFLSEKYTNINYHNFVYPKYNRDSKLLINKLLNKKNQANIIISNNSLSKDMLNKNFNLKIFPSYFKKDILDVMILSKNKDIFFYDKSCTFYYSKCLNKDHVLKYQEELKRFIEKHDLIKIEENDEIILFNKK